MAKGYKGAKDGCVAVRMVLHGLAHDIGHLGVPAIVHFGHCVQHSALNGLETVHNMGNGTVQNGVGRVVQIPLLEHAGKLEIAGVVTQQFLEFPRRGGVFSQFLVFLFLRILDVVPVFCHKLEFVSEPAKLLAALPPVRVNFNKGT